MTQDKPTLAIIGCGWLGRHILPILTQKFTIVATTAHQQTAEQLCVTSYVYDWTQDTLPAALLEADYYFIAIPPTAGGYAQYATNVKRLASDLPSNKPVLFISSTGIYPSAAGIYQEKSPIEEDSAIYQAEKMLMSMISSYTILRCSGLFGDGRLSGQNYYGQQVNDMPNKRLNLIHYQDIANAIILIIKQAKWTTIYNLAHPEHPFRHEYYQAQARIRKQQTPIFTNKTIEPDRIISGNKISKELNFYYQYPPTQTL